MNRKHRSLLLAGMLALHAGAQAADELVHGSTPAGPVRMDGRWVCEAGGRIGFDFSITNESGHDLVFSTDDLPWSAGPGGAKIEVKSMDGEFKTLEAVRPAAEPPTSRVLGAGRTSTFVDVRAMFPRLREFVERHGDATIGWDYTLKTDAGAQGSAGNTVIWARADDRCFQSLAAAPPN